MNVTNIQDYCRFIERLKEKSLLKFNPEMGFFIGRFNEKKFETFFSRCLLSIILGPLFLLFLIPFYIRPTIYSGDEPHYLILANSIRFDRDLELGSDYKGVRNGSNRAGKIFTGIPLDHHTVITTSDSNGFSKSLGAWHDFFDADHRARWNIPKPPPLPQTYNEKSARAIGWPLVIAGTSLLMPWISVESLAKVLSHICVFLTSVFVALVLKKRGGSPTSWLAGGLCLFLGSSYWVYANSAFADPLLGLIVASSIFCLELSVYPITLACLMILGAWVKFQFLPIALVLVVLSFLRYSSKTFLKIIIVSAGGIIALIVFNLMEYGHMSPPMRWIQSNPIEAFHYFFVDPSTSILIRNPWLIAVLTAFCLPQVRHAIRIAPSFWLLLGSLIIVPLSWGFYSGGYCYPGRLILPALIPAALLFGALFDVAEKKGKILLCLSLAASILVNFAASVSDPRATWAPTLEWLGVLSSPFLNR